eukprot:scaffold360_cov334-Prasinococcus_capsulatus_cf.AAC.11
MTHDRDLARAGPAPARCAAAGSALVLVCRAGRAQPPQQVRMTGPVYARGARRPLRSVRSPRFLRLAGPSATVPMWDPCSTPVGPVRHAQKSIHCSA